MNTYLGSFITTKNSFKIKYYKKYHEIGLQLLIKKQACICGDIVDELPLSQSTVSQHLKELKESGFVNCKFVKTKSIYSVNWEIFEQFSQETLVFIKDMLKKK